MQNCKNKVNFDNFVNFRISHWTRSYKKCCNLFKSKERQGQYSINKVTTSHYFATELGLASRVKVQLLNQIGSRAFYQKNCRQLSSEQIHDVHDRRGRIRCFWESIQLQKILVLAIFIRLKSWKQSSRKSII